MREEIKKEIDIWAIWSRNFYNAKRFFQSKGNIKTRSRLKDKWFKDCKNDLISVKERKE